MAKDATQDLWPRWPAGHEHPVSLVDIRVKLDVDKLFQLLYAPGSEYVVSKTDSDGTIFSVQYSRQCLESQPLQPQTEKNLLIIPAKIIFGVYYRPSLRRCEATRSMWRPPGSQT